jgi:primosomal replication protein N''
MIQAIERMNDVLSQLEHQARLTDSTNEQRKSHYLLQNDNLFSESLFITNSDKFLPYVMEVKQKIVELSRLLKNKNNTLSHSRLQQIEQQISSIISALNANGSIHQEAQYRLDAIKARKFKKAAKTLMQSSQALYQKLTEHHEFERRLAEMLAAKEQQRCQAPKSKVTKLGEEVLILHQRLGRCRQAISKIEREIEKAEKLH